MGVTDITNVLRCLGGNVPPEGLANSSALGYSKTDGCLYLINGIKLGVALVVIPSLEGMGRLGLRKRVEIFGEPPKMCTCLGFLGKRLHLVKGHSGTSKKGKAIAVDEDGFTKATKGKWRPKPKPIWDLRRETQE
ncbi:hypothetical protein OSB04_un001317 [Centaurea solstitialis]|uniref:Uncharacterized protein n=1 Tax=Centaurea solstitialis TaxID=347529 RepID=A0AA38VUR2_9ASTR|nr:hypothetical protein OSB04_un001317 [Centaurea solstitialis]